MDFPLPEKLRNYRLSQGKGGRRELQSVKREIRGAQCRPELKRNRRGQQHQSERDESGNGEAEFSHGTQGDLAALPHAGLSIHRRTLHGFMALPTASLGAVLAAGHAGRRSLRRQRDRRCQ